MDTGVYGPRGVRAIQDVALENTHERVHVLVLLQLMLEYIASEVIHKPDNADINCVKWVGKNTEYSHLYYGFI